METGKLSCQISHLALAGLTGVFRNRHDDLGAVLMRTADDQFFDLMRCSANANDIKHNVTAIRASQQLDANRPVRIVLARRLGGGQIPGSYSNF